VSELERPSSQFLVYADEAGRLKFDVRLDGETVWLIQQAMAELFQTTRQNISLHVKIVYNEGGLDHEATHKDYLSIRAEGGREVRRRLTTTTSTLVFAEGQAMHRIPLSMTDWVVKLDAFLFVGVGLCYPPPLDIDYLGGLN
jgi:hypothetical protein